MTGSGTLLDPYVIWDVNDLQDMNLDLAAYYELGCDIDASATVGWNGGEGFIPVGSWPAPAVAFTGHFDGKGHVITGLTMNRLPPIWGNFQALFGYTENCGEIKNVELENCDIAGFEWIGALVGFHDSFSPNGKISNCHSTGRIRGWVGTGGLLGYNGAEVEDCDSDCEIISEAGALAAVEEVGGLIGENDGELTRCHATGNLTCTSDWDVWGVGGLLGLDSWGGSFQCYATGNISAIALGDVYEIGGFAGETGGDLDSECFATGNVYAVAGITGHWNFLWGVGGFAGMCDAELTKDCYARGDVHAEHPSDGEAVGGFAGYHYYVIDDCYSTGKITTVGVFIEVGGFCGGIDGAGVITPECFWDTETSGMLVSAGGTGKTTAQMKTESTFTDAGWDFATIWDITPSCNNDYPCLLNVTPDCGVPVAPFVINKSYALAREEL